MKQRIVTACVALALFLPFLIIGGIPFQIVGAILAVIGVYEIFRMKGLTIASFEGIISALGAVILVLPNDPWFKFLPETTNKMMLFYFLVMLLLGISVISKNTYTIDEAGFPVVASLYVGAGFGSLVQARLDSIVVLLFGLFVVWATDSGAYFVGRKYGQKKLWPEISPNKTLEGSLGGIGSAIIITLLFYVLFPAKDTFHMGLFSLVLVTIVLSIVGQFGDLVESAMKRHYNIKDSGTILPGHGGILDRMDSVLFVFPMMNLLGLF